MTRVPAALALAAALPFALAGCGVMAALQKPPSGTAPTTEALHHAWHSPATEPDWVPADSTGIRYIAATGGGADRSPASVRVTTTSALPATCTTISRPSADRFGERWAPTRFPDRVERCGNWAVMRVPGGWFGWTPLTP